MKRWKSLLVLLVLLLPAFASPQTASPAEAMALEQQGKLPEAVEAWRAVTEHNPRDAERFASLGVGWPGKLSTKRQPQPTAGLLP